MMDEDAWSGWRFAEWACDDYGKSGMESMESRRESRNLFSRLKCKWYQNNAGVVQRQYLCANTMLS